MGEVADDVVPEDLCYLGSARSHVNSHTNSGTSCNRLLDAHVVSCSSGVNSLVFSAESAAELVRCASLDEPRTTIKHEDVAFARCSFPFVLRFGV